MKGQALILKKSKSIHFTHPPVEIIEEGEHEEGHLAPSLFLTELKRIIIHDTRWVIQQLLGVCGTVKVPAEPGEEHSVGSTQHYITVQASRLLLIHLSQLLDSRLSIMPSAKTL